MRFSADFSKEYLDRIVACCCRCCPLCLAKIFKLRTLVDCRVKSEYANSVMPMPLGSQPLLMIELDYSRDIGVYIDRIG